jgi:hypothetical protein
LRVQVGGQLSQLYRTIGNRQMSYTAAYEILPIVEGDTSERRRAMYMVASQISQMAQQAVDDRSCRATRVHRESRIAL